MVKRISKLKCPTCGNPVAPADEGFPFCGERCRLIDLGKWASGVYKISTPVLDPDVLDEIGAAREHENTPNGDNDDDAFHDDRKRFS